MYIVNAKCRKLSFSSLLCTGFLHGTMGNMRFSHLTDRCIFRRLIWPMHENM